MAKADTAKASADQDWKYKVEDGVRAMMRAEEIKKDPKLYQACLKEMENQMAAMHRAMGEHTGKSLMKALGKNKQED